MRFADRTFPEISPVMTVVLLAKYDILNLNYKRCQVECKIPVATFT